MIKVGIFGYYGYGDTADEMSLLAIIEALRANYEGVEISVFSNDPQLTEVMYGVTAYNCHNWFHLHKGISENDMIICGDSSLMREDVDFRSYYQYTRMIRMAVRRKKPVFVYGQGFSDIAMRFGQTLTVKALRKASRVTVRDEASASCIFQWGMRRGRVNVTGNPLFNLVSYDACWDLSQFTAIAEELQRKSNEQVVEDTAAETVEAPVEPMDVRDVEIPMEQFAMVVPEGEQQEKATASEDDLEQQEKATASEDDLIEIEIILNEEAEETASVPGIEDVEEEVIDFAEPEKVEEPIPALRNDVICSLRLLNAVPGQWALEDTGLAVFCVSQDGPIPTCDLVALADETVRMGYTVVMIPFRYDEDLQITKNVLAEMNEFAELFDPGDPLTPQEVVNIISAADLVVGMDLTVLMMAALQRKPFVTLNNSDEIRDFYESLGVSFSSNLMDYEYNGFLNDYRNVVEDPSALLAALEENLPALCKKAEETNALLDVIVQRVVRRSGRVKRTRAEKIAMLEERKAAKLASDAAVAPVIESEEEDETEDDYKMDVSVVSIDADGTIIPEEQNEREESEESVNAEESTVDEEEVAVDERTDSAGKA